MYLLLRPRRRTLACKSTRTVPIGDRTWNDIEPEDYFAHRLPSVKTTEYSSSSWSSTSRTNFVRSQHGSDEMWKSTMAKGGGNKKRFQYCTDPSGKEILYLRALQSHSGRNLVDLSLQDNVIIQSVGCAISLHSTMNLGLIPGGQILSKRQTVFFTSVDPMNEERRDPDIIDLEAPRLAWYKQKMWKKHQNTVYWVDIKLAQKKVFKFYKHDRTQSSFTTHSQLIVS